MKVRVDKSVDECEEIAFVYLNFNGKEEVVYLNEENASVDIMDNGNKFVITSTDWGNFVKAANMMDAKLKEISYEW